MVIVGFPFLFESNDYENSHFAAIASE